MSLWFVALLFAASPAVADPWNTLCAGCHGETGRGDGPAADLLWPRPGDLTRPELKFGMSADAIRAVVRRGVPGTAMPSFGQLDPATLDAVVDRILAGRPPVDSTPTAPIEPMPDARADDVERGEVAWTAQGCGQCHGPEGGGDGPLAGSLRDADGAPADLYDLRSAPLKGGERIDALFASITRGRPGTPMVPHGHLPATTRRALAALLVSRRRPDARPQWRLPPAVAPGVAQDRWWGRRPLPDPGPVPDAVVPAVADGHPQRCGICHPNQHAGWLTSRHAAAAGPGLRGQDHGATAETIAECNACHAPRAAQQVDLERRALGVTCAGCHVRAHRKHGPPGPSSMRIPAPGLRPTVEPRFARSDYCMPCHNLPMIAAIEGRPLLDTWREWAASPYLPAGVQCQHCHQPEGAHRFAGAHDAEMVRRAVRLTADARIDGSRVVVEATVRNVGAGHHFPTTATPRAVLRIRQLGSDGPLPGTEESWAIGRTMTVEDGRWKQVSDTRIPAGEVRGRRYTRALHADATRAEVSLHLFPDWFYAGFYRSKLKRADLDPRARADFEAALAEAEASVILVDYVRLPLTAGR